MASNKMIAVDDDTTFAVTDRGVQIRSIEDLERVARIVVASGLAPRGDNAQAVAVKIQMGLEVGLKPMASLNKICVINNRPSLFGDAGKALLLRSGLLADAPKTTFEGKKFEPEWTCTVRMKRKGFGGEFVGTFSWEQAVKAGLTKKSGPWQDYPERQMAWRAWWWAAREGFSDVLGGLDGAEELYDMPQEPRTVTIEQQRPAQAPPETLDDLADLAVVGLPQEAPESPVEPAEPTAPPKPRKTRARKQRKEEAAPEPPEPEPEEEWDSDPSNPALWWQCTPELPLEVAYPCPDIGLWAEWKDTDIPKSKLADRAPTWAEAAKGSKGGGRHALLLDIVAKAQRTGEGPSVSHQRAAATLAVLLAGTPPEPGFQGRKTVETPDDLPFG